MKVKEVYEFLDSYAPFAQQDEFDNSGLLIGDENSTVKGICLCLDITNAVIKEAVSHRANLIISHHPVIFDPLKCLEAGTPTYELAKHKLSAICMHTNADMAEYGVTDIMIELLGFDKSDEVLEPVLSDGKGYGKVCKLPIPTRAASLAESCRDAFDCAVVRYSDTDRTITKVAVCSGAGGSAISHAVKAGCDAFITGDIKHSQWIEAQTHDLCLIDAGHFHTENILCNYLCGILSRKFHDIEIFTAQNSKDPCAYII